MHSAPFEEAFARLSPAALAIGLMKDASGKVNPITLAWFTRVSKEPPMLAIAIGRDKYSFQALSSSGEFVLAIPSEHQAEETLVYGTVSGRDADKLSRTGARTARASTIDAALLVNAVANYECVVREQVTTGDHVLFIGEVVAAHENEDRDLRPLYALPGNRMGGV